MKAGDMTPRNPIAVLDEKAVRSVLVAVLAERRAAERRSGG